MLQLALIGLGGWGRKLVESVQGVSPDVRFSTAIVRRTDTAAQFAQKHGLKLETDIAGTLRDPAISGFVSSGPAHLHGAHGLQVLEAGKHLLAIKPLTLTASEGRAMLSAAGQRNSILALGYNRCFYPNVIEMRRRIRAGDLGELVHAEGDFCVDRYRAIKPGAWKGDPARQPAGALADHMLYLTIDTLGPIAEVHALGFRHHSENELADTTAVMLRTQNRQSALLTAIGVTPDYYRFQIFGTGGWIELRDDAHFAFQPLKGERETLVFPSIDAERAEVEAFAAAIAGKQPFPVPAADAAHSAAVIEAMGRSALESRPVLVDQV